MYSKRALQYKLNSPAAKLNCAKIVAHSIIIFSQRDSESRHIKHHRERDGASRPVFVCEGIPFAVRVVSRVTPPLRLKGNKITFPG